MTALLRSGQSNDIPLLERALSLAQRGSGKLATAAEPLAKFLVHVLDTTAPEAAPATLSPIKTPSPGAGAESLERALRLARRSQVPDEVKAEALREALTAAQQGDDLALRGGRRGGHRHPVPGNAAAPEPHGLFRIGGVAPGAWRGSPRAVRELEQLSREDALLRLEASNGPAFQLSPPLERVLADLQRQREQLRALWDEARLQTGRPDGRKLETFAAAFFGEAFTVTTDNKNVRTDTEELDLVLQHSRDTDPVFRKGAYLVVECKDWRAQAVDQGTVSKLAGVLATHRIKQGFLLTTGTFSPEAVQQAWNISQSMQVEIVLIDGTAVESFLREVRPVSDFLVDLHRRLLLRVA